jgi:hypothetical protein
MSTIAAGTTSGTALVSTGDTTGALVLQTNGTTTAVTIGTNQVVTLAQPLPVASGGTGGSATPTAGGVVYGTGTVQAVSAAGTSGQLLRSNGASAPSWVTPSAGALVYLSTVTASAVATADIETTFNSTYDNYLLIGTVTPSSNGQGIECLMKIGGVYVTTGYMSHTTLSQSSSSSYLGTSGATTYFYAATGTLNTAAASANFQMTIYNPSSTVLAKQVSVIGLNQTDATTVRQAYTAALNTGTAALTGIRIYAPVGTITGTFRLYGIANS